MNFLTVILSVWKRETLKRQLEAIYNGTLLPNRTIIYQNECHVDISSIAKEYDCERIKSIDHNHRYHARFSIPLFCDSEYFSIFDDDTIPGRKWHEYAASQAESLDGIIGANGRSFLTNINKQIATGGVSSGQFPEKAVYSDIVGHAWFAKKQHFHNMWSRKPLSLETGEDIHFSIVNKVFYGVNTFVPAQPKDDPDVWGDCDPQLGADLVASWRGKEHTKARMRLYRDWLEAGWVPYYNFDKSSGKVVFNVARPS